MLGFSLSFTRLKSCQNGHLGVICFGLLALTLCQSPLFSCKGKSHISLLNQSEEFSIGRTVYHIILCPGILQLYLVYFRENIWNVILIKGLLLHYLL